MGWFVRAVAAPLKLRQAIADEVAKERRLRLTDGGAWGDMFGRESHAGEVVTMDSAMRLSTVWACIRMTTQAVGALPLATYDKEDGGSRVRVDDRLSDILGDSPNEDQTALEFWETMVAWLLTGGNAYAEKAFTGPNLSALQPLPGNRTMPFRKDGELFYRFSDRGRAEILPRDKVFHLKGFGQGLNNPDLGLSPIAYGTNAIGAATAADRVSGSTFANGLRPSGMLEVGAILTPEQRQQVRENIIKPLQGSRNAGGIGLLEGGMKWADVAMNPEDAQLLETRRFSVEELCRLFGVPPIIIGHAAQGQTMWGTGVEQILLSWLTLGIDPLCDRIEARIRKQIIRPTGNRRRYAEFNREALLQMDSAGKASFLSQMVQNGLMDRNEGRQKLNLPTRDGADVLTAQTNLAPLDQLGGASDAGNTVRAAMRSWLGMDDGQTEGKGDE